MRQAREILREYLKRRRPDEKPVSAASLQEENLRRLLRRVGAAHSPSEPFEAKLRHAMLREAAELRARPRRGWPRLPSLAGRAWVPAAALAMAGLAFAVQLYRFRPAVSTREPDTIKVVAEGGGMAHPSIPLPVDRAQHPRIGSVLMSQGELLRQRAGDQGWEAVESGTSVHLGDTLRTAANAAGSIVFLDSSICELAADTALSFEGAAQAELERPLRVRLARGETWNQVEKGGPTFQVQTPAATAAVRGTSFGVKVDQKGRKTTLRVQEGSVELQNPQGAVLVPAGMLAVAVTGRAPQRPAPLAPARRPQPGRKQPGTLKLAPANERVPKEEPPQSSGPDQKKATFSRSPGDAAPSAPGKTSPPGAPPEVSGPSTTGSSDRDEPGRRIPSSTSR